MKTLREEIIKIMVKHQFNGKGIVEPKWSIIADEILALGWYPKEFVEWNIVNGFKCYPDGDYGFCDSDLLFKTLDGLYNHWKTEVNHE